MNNTHITTILLLALLLVCSLSATAQVPPPPPPQEVPLDPLSWALLGAGGAAAVKKYRDMKRKRKDEGI